MYLSGPMTFRFPDGHTEVLNPGAPMTWLADFLRRQGVAVRSDGSAMTRSQILGGELFDGCPANVILSDGQWLPEQLDAINTNPAVKSAVLTCRYFPAPPAAGAPNLTANNAPGATSTGEVVTRSPAVPAGMAPAGSLVPTGVVTPTVITVPGGGGFIEAPAPAPASPGPTTEAAGFGALPMILLGGAALWFFTRKQKGA